VSIESRITCDITTGETIEETFEHIPPTFTEIKQQKITEIKQKAAGELSATDYKVIRHRDQLAASLPTTLTSTEYQTLLTQRQAIRDKSNNLEAQVNAATTETVVNSVVW